MDILKERQQFLKKELEEYVDITPMTGDEREALHWWVNKGHSVHENWSLACRDGGAPLDFLDVYRDEMEEQVKLSAMSEEERKIYLYEEYGFSNDPKTDKNLEAFIMEDSPWVEL